MKHLLIPSLLIVSSLSINAQNTVQYASNNLNIQSNYNLNENNLFNNQGNRGGSSALGNIGNSSNKNKVKVQQQTTIKTNKNKSNNNTQVQVADINVIENVGNVYVADDNVGNQNPINRGGSNPFNFNSNPVANDVNTSPKVQVQTNTSQPIKKQPVQEYQGLDFKPSGLSGRDYSNGGKLKKGQKNFYTQSKSKPKKMHGKKRPSFKKVKHHTSKCAKW